MTIIRKKKSLKIDLELGLAIFFLLYEEYISYLDTRPQLGNRYMITFFGIHIARVLLLLKCSHLKV